MDQEFVDDTTNPTPNGSQNKTQTIFKKLKKLCLLLPLFYLCYIGILVLLIIFASRVEGIGAGYFAMGLLSLLVADFLPGSFILSQIINFIPPNLLFPFRGDYFLFFIAIIFNFVAFYLIGLLIDKRKTIIKRMKNISPVGYVVILGVILLVGGFFFYTSNKSTVAGWIIEENSNNQLGQSKLLTDHQIISKKLSEIPLKYINLENPDGIRYPTLYFSNDGTQFAYEIKNGLVINNEMLQGLGIYNFSFSPDSGHYAYTAVSREVYGGKVTGGEFIVIDDKKQSYSLPSRMSDGVIFSPDSKHYAYEIEMPGYNSAMLIDNHVGPKYSYNSSFAFSPDSKHYAYVGTNIDPPSRILIVDGKVTKNIDPYFLVFSPDGQKLAYVMGSFVFVNDVRDKNSYEYLGPLQFSSDGKHYAYAGTKDKKTSIILDDQEIEKYEDENVSFGITLSPDGSKVALRGKKRIINEKTFIPPKEFIIFDGQQGPEYDAVSNLVFSPDGKNFVYSAKDGAKNFIIYNNQKTETCYGLIANIHFSEDGSKLIYNAMVGQEIWLVVDDMGDGISFCEKKDFKPLISQKLEECNKIADLSAKQSCYLDYANKTGDYSICEDQIFDQINKVICYSSVAIRGDNIVLCNYAKDQSIIDKCYAAVPPGVNHSVGRCDQVQNSESKDTCLLNVAVTNKDKTICDGLSTQRDPCYSNVAIAKNDLSLCNLIKEDFFKRSCIKVINQANSQ